MAKILVVDDDPDFVAFTRDVLKRQNHEVITSASGRQALDVMRKNKPDLVLLDVMMSYLLDGLHVSEEMHKDPELSQIPVIVVTSLIGRPDKERLSVADWLSKPVQPKELLEKVSFHLPPPAPPQPSGK
ncbi:MAG: response regulator [Chloroflexi bacterium]|nr:response regulator [Chloroflexota bacterium]